MTRTLSLIAFLFSTPASANICKASWYGGSEKLNRHTANGEVFNRNAMTAAHRSWKFGTRVKVTYNGKSVIVRINDRGPAKWTGKCIDLSRGAADKIGMRKNGVGTVKLEVIK